jgi:hypothetical protein
MNLRTYKFKKSSSSLRLVRTTSKRSNYFFSLEVFYKKKKVFCREKVGFFEKIGLEKKTRHIFYKVNHDKLYSLLVFGAKPSLNAFRFLKLFL